MKLLSIIGLVTILFSSCNAQNITEIKVLQVDNYAERIADNKVTLVDVRTPDEYSAGHLINAVNINYLAPTFLEYMQQFDKEKPIYIYCQSGNRSGKAAISLVENGFKNVIDLAGGYRAWSASNLPTE